ncbi:hypothetical protein [Desulfonatronum sp. SC1]|uniref:hypothetical protein n=1 Tax=Desulfonatronum sp. SC1 TaxID=2109626 RepID=UPI000D30B96B|nr:hypothetical protein [Desulfonatronum sp. SC1]PTN37047.1 hypothetical protein C6366_08060 [Desulfonatronum sp. SC1]
MVQQVQLPVLLSLLPKVGKMIQAEQDRPAMQQALAGSLMQEALKKERERIPEVKKTEESFQVRPEDEQDQSRSGRQPRRDHRRQAEPDEEPQAGKDPWSGQIVNLKI